MEAGIESLIQKGEPPRNPDGSLHAPRGPELEERGDYSGPVLGSSIYTAASLHPVRTALLAVGAGVAVAALLGGRSNGSD